MSSTPSVKSSTPAGRGAKSKSPKVLVLKLSASALSQFPHESPTPTPTPSKSAIASDPPSTTSTPAPAPKESSSPIEEIQADEKVGTPTDTAATLKVPEDGRRKGVGGPKAGVKRSSSVMNDGLPKPRAKPGPKKRRLDGANGEEVGRPWTTPAPTTTHKLGPKANQGAINAGLRALDRTGKPCRKWKKTGFQLKSFTGVVWSLPSWGAPKRASEIKEPEQSDSNNENNETIPLANGSAVDSENGLDKAAEMNGTTESPTVAVEVAAS